MAAQRRENEDPELSLVPKTPETPISLPSAPAASAVPPPPPRRFPSSASPARPSIRTADEAPQPLAERREVNRCSGCRRKVGLTGFRCRCGDLFCSEHRYSDRHVCGYDYKAVGREAIARENPLVKAAKIIRI